MNRTVDSIIERDREKLIASLQENIRIPSTEGLPEEGMPFGKTFPTHCTTRLTPPRRSA